MEKNMLLIVLTLVLFCLSLFPHICFFWFLFLLVKTFVDFFEKVYFFLVGFIVQNGSLRSNTVMSSLYLLTLTVTYFQLR